MAVDAEPVKLTEYEDAAWTLVRHLIMKNMQDYLAGNTRIILLECDQPIIVGENNGS